MNPEVSGHFCVSASHALSPSISRSWGPLGSRRALFKSQVGAQSDARVCDGLGVGVQIALGCDQRSVPSDLPEHVDRYTSVISLLHSCTPPDPPISAIVRAISMMMLRHKMRPIPPRLAAANPAVFHSAHDWVANHVSWMVIVGGLLACSRPRRYSALAHKIPITRDRWSRAARWRRP